jgi:hypothetical protein
MEITNVACNYHWNGHDPVMRMTYEFSGKEVAEALLKQINRPNIDAFNAFVVCPKCDSHIEIEELKVKLVVNLYKKDGIK